MQKLSCGLIVLASLAMSGCGHLSKRIAEGIESAGSEVTGVPVQVDQVQLGLFRGAGRISGVTVANPEGYQEEFAFRMDELGLNLKVLSLLGRNPVVLQELVVDSPVLIFEPNDRGGSNLRDIADYAAAHAKPPPAKPADPEPTEVKSPKAPLRIAVQRLDIQGIGFQLLHLDGSFLAGTLPSIKLTDVGGREGKTSGELGTVIVSAMARQMFLQIAGRKLGEMLKDVEINPALFDSDRILGQWGEILGLSSHQTTQMKPFVEEQCVIFHSSLNQAQDQGFLDLDLLSRQFMNAAEQASHELDGVLTEEQKKQLALLFDEWSQLTIENIWDARVAELTKFLGLNPEQMEPLGTILQDQVRERAKLLDRFVHDLGQSADEFNMAYTGLQEAFRQRLEEVLTPAQLLAWTERQLQVQRWIHEIFLDAEER